MRSRLEHIVEMLRDAAEDEHEDAPAVPIADTISWEAADLIEWLMVALALIRDGAPDPAATAGDALSDARWQAAGPAGPPRSKEHAEWVRITTEQIVARLRGETG